MSLQELEALLSQAFNPDAFLNIGGVFTGNKIGNLVEEKINLSAKFREEEIKIFRGSSKGYDNIGIYAVRVTNPVLFRAAKSRREIANIIIRENQHNDALVAFYSPGVYTWRLGFVRGYRYDALESLREFFVGQGLAIRTAKEQLGKVCDLPSTTELSERSVKLNESFSVEAVSDNFYKQFKQDHFDVIVSKLMDRGESKENAEDLSVLFTIRIMFLGFVQKKGWLDDDQNFLQNLLKTYQQHLNHSGFYDHWLRTLFFNALNGFCNNINENDLPEQIRSTYKMLPYLNGGLFQEHEVDKRKYAIPDEQIQNFFAFLFSYNFTIEENTLQEQSLELNPELLGVIFERLVNKANGAIYTPRTEVDFMCRISLVKWLQQNLEGDDKPEDRDLFELFFREKSNGKDFDNDRKNGNFSISQRQTVLAKLKNIAICDPAVGSGAFPVNMMQVLNEVQENLGEDSSEKVRYERKKYIIDRNLYGVEVNQWAVWICQLRLWLSLFIDAPNDLRQNLEPILPSLDFKILQGDSLVQMIGDTLIPIEGHAAIDASLKKRVAELRNLKARFYNNKLPASVTLQMIHNAEVALMKSIIVEQRNAKQKDLQILRHKESITQQSLLGDDTEKVVQQALGDAEERKRIDEINKFDDMLNNLSKSPKTIWSISFAEVFGDKAGFDIVIGNPPYITYKNIEDPSNRADAVKYKLQLKESINQDFPSHFKHCIVDGKSDLYTYFFIKAAKLLNASGTSVYICSNSWLDNDFGVWLQNFFLKNLSLSLIMDSSAKRTFKNADVNTVISVFNKSKNQPLTKFVMFNKPFEESFFTERLLDIENTSTDIFTNDMKVITKTREQLIKSGSEKNGGMLSVYTGEKWGGLYLRAPIFFSQLMSHYPASFIKLKDLQSVNVLTGLKESGYANYMSDGKKLDKKIIASSIPILKNVKRHNNITIETADSFITERVSYFEQSVRSKHATILWLTGRGSTHKCFFNKNDYPFTGNFIGINVQDNMVFDLLALLNSTLVIFFSEILNRGKGIGGGACVFTGSDIKNMLIPRISLFKPSTLNTAAAGLYTRNYHNVFEESGLDPESTTPINQQEPKPLTDRAKLDNLIFEAIGMSDEERKNVYRAVCQLVQNRLSKANSL